MLPFFHGFNNQFPSLFDTFSTSSDDDYVISIALFRHIDCTSRFFPDRHDSLTAFADHEMMMFGRDAEISGALSLIFG